VDQDQGLEFVSERP